MVPEVWFIIGTRSYTIGAIRTSISPLLETFFSIQVPLLRPNGIEIWIAPVLMSWLPGWLLIERNGF